VKKIILLSFLSLLACTSQIRYSDKKPAPKINVLLQEASAITEIRFNGKYKLLSEEAGYEFGEKNSRIKLQLLTNKYKLFNENRILVFPNSESIALVAERTENSFSIGNNDYYGSLLIMTDSDKNIILVNRLDLEQYLKGVVPAEIPTKSHDNFEAAKAQAILARTYALGKLENVKKRKFHIYSDTRDQVYKGKKAQTILGNKAVKETEGDVLVFNDTLAAVYYHSTCGGMMESANNLWSGTEKPYLNVGQDILGNTIACDLSPRYRWSRSYTFRALDSLIVNKWSVSALNRIVEDTTKINLKIEIQSRTDNKRVKKIKIEYADTTLYLKDYEIRKFFVDETGQPLPSNLFNINQDEIGNLLINGGGFGHGVGLCQWGALNMSQQGLKYYDILINKYFKGTKLKKAY